MPSQGGFRDALSKRDISKSKLLNVKFRTGFKRQDRLKKGIRMVKQTRVMIEPPSQLGYSNATDEETDNETADEETTDEDDDEELFISSSSRGKKESEQQGNWNLKSGGNGKKKKTNERMLVESSSKESLKEVKNKLDKKLAKENDNQSSGTLDPSPPQEDSTVFGWRTVLIWSGATITVVIIIILLVWWLRKRRMSIRAREAKLRLGIISKNDTLNHDGEGNKNNVNSSMNSTRPVTPIIVTTNASSTNEPTTSTTFKSSLSKSNPWAAKPLSNLTTTTNESSLLPNFHAGTPVTSTFELSNSNSTLAAAAATTTSQAAPPNRFQTPISPPPGSGGNLRDPFNSNV